MCPLSSASIKATLSIKPPLLQLMSIAPGFIKANLSTRRKYICYLTGMHVAIPAMPNYEPWLQTEW